MDGSRGEIIVRPNADTIAIYEARGDPAFTWVLVALGVRSLSMSPRFIPTVKSIIGASTLGEMEALLAQALSLRSEVEVEELVLGLMGRRFPLELETAGG